MITKRAGRKSREPSSELQLNEELEQLRPLVGKWTFTGSFKGDRTKRVEGWETYEVIDGGAALHCTWAVYTIGPDGTDVNDGAMRIAYDKRKSAILGDHDWTLRLTARCIFTVQNDSYRFRGTLNKRAGTITGAWQTREGSRWKYWYDKTMRSVPIGVSRS